MMNITKREVLVSVVIVCLMILLGILIADKINDFVMEKHQEYNTALQIESDKEMFEYGMRTNIGNAFVYGDLKAVGPVTFLEIEGSYSYVKKVKEKYTQHTRIVTYTENGKTKTRTEVYYTWDEVCSEEKHSEKISFLDVEFDYGMIEFPSSTYICTIKESSKIRYKYYGAPSECTGTLYANLGDKTITNTHFYNNCTISETIDNLESNWEIVLFWIAWVLLTGGLVYGFYYIDNHWLEDSKWR